MREEIGGTCSTHGRDAKNAYRIFVGNSGGEIVFGRPLYKEEDDIKLYFKQIMCDILC
jgi:hypothetical protein